MVQYFDGRRGALWQGSPKGSTAMQWRRAGFAAALPLAADLPALAGPAAFLAGLADLAGLAERLFVAGRGRRADFAFADFAFLPRTGLMLGST